MEKRKSTHKFSRIKVNLQCDRIEPRQRTSAGDDSQARRTQMYVEPGMRKPNAVAGRLCYIEVKSLSDLGQSQTSNLLKLFNLLFSGDDKRISGH